MHLNALNIRSKIGRVSPMLSRLIDKTQFHFATSLIKGMNVRSNWMYGFLQHYHFTQLFSSQRFQIFPFVSNSVNLCFCGSIHTKFLILSPSWKYYPPPGNRPPCHLWCVTRFGTICTILKTWKTPMKEC